jgi:hypothetical protein
MLLQELHAHYGTWSKMTRELELGTSTYQAWLKKGYIPYPSQLIIEKKTRGKFKADISHGKPKS